MQRIVLDTIGPMDISKDFRYIIVVERANKEINCHIRNILADKELVENWPQMLCMTE